ncbi:EAL domain-containing protein [Pseudoroseomonas wenyumeiae]|uniref:EAL domain-containing protein n=2 Tax=Teichococcus wenyumeiae TaxID=2478470 RepID=A0A3A9JF03_9PROT|nr:EAL domain-containing protein [Pseudoroseomonas wenyumeiae]RMI24847.1 EAL domain-containing protein [Pseudoroseomonas wenyumeiae]
MQPSCARCRNTDDFDIPISMAFQPILRAPVPGTPSLFAYEALVRGKDGAGAASVLARVNSSNRYAFDQACRVKAIEMATKLDLPATGALLSINFLPNAVYEPRNCIRATLAAAQRTGFPLSALMFEVTEQEQVEDPEHLLHILNTYRQIGFRTAIDDFGAGYSGLSLLARFQPDVVKLDMGLVRGADADPARVIILRHTAAMCRELGVTLVAEGVETAAELAMLRRLGIDIFQGYYFARPGFEHLPMPHLPC